MNNNEVNRLIDIVKKLRAPDGCPWDREQTHQSVRGHLVEECAELLEAIDLQDSDKMREEIGDVLMHLLLHAEIESENGNFNFNDVAKELGDKLVRRHPHVFGEEKVNDSDDVLKIWQDVKKKEKKERAIGGLFAGIPPQLSALRYAYSIAKKADAETLADASENSQKLGDKNIEIGRELFSIIAKASEMKVEPESALRDYLLQIRKSAEKLGK
ncbi:MAG: MazG family protein [Opitutales bacterium]|nr:MazG family protein [Opitutales bacterium]MBQ2721807.1 MazG family protein [Opitutales bacterium]MBR7105449.1 MazG family protein [Opitutales bacterium]